MKVDSYSFGEIVIDGKRYTKDVIIFKDRVKSWWRKEGHLLQVEDIEDVIEEKPDVLVVGTGAYGVMRVDEGIRKVLEEKGIGLIEKKSKEACEEFNNIKDKYPVLAIHLTC